MTIAPVMLLTDKLGVMPPVTGRGLKSRRTARQQVPAATGHELNVPYFHFIE
jgi:hypothetical protein